MSPRLVYSLVGMLFMFGFVKYFESQFLGPAVTSIRDDPLAIGASNLDAVPTSGMLQTFGEDLPNLSAFALETTRDVDENADRIMSRFSDNPQFFSYAELPRNGSIPYQGLAMLTVEGSGGQRVTGRFIMRVFFGRDVSIIGGIGPNILIIDESPQSPDSKLSTIAAPLHLRARESNARRDTSRAIIQAQVTGTLGVPGRITGRDRATPYDAQGAFIGVFTSAGIMGLVELVAIDEAGETITFSGSFAGVNE